MTTATPTRRSPSLPSLPSLAAALCLLGLALLPHHAHARLKGPGLTHCTKEGETPRQIARRYGVKLSNLRKGSGNVQKLMLENIRIRKWNKAQKKASRERYKKRLRAWKRTPRGKRGKRPKMSFKPKKQRRFEAWTPVRIVRPKRNDEVRDAVIRLSRGASVKWVAKTFGVDPKVVRCVNHIPKNARGVGCKRKRIPGPRRRGQPRFVSTCTGGRQWLLARLPFPKRPGKPSGLPTGGRLRSGEKLPRVPGLTAKQPQNTFAASHVITRLIDAVGYVHKRIGETPDLVVGDISRKGGGRFKPHRSHQNGLDVDIGYYHLGKVRTDRFTKVTPKNLDKARTWALVRRLLESGEVQYIFMSTRVQKLIRPYMKMRNKTDGAWCMRFLKTLSNRRRYGRPNKVSRKWGAMKGWVRCVKRSFGHRGFRNALIRHAKGHDDHMHVRFFPRRGRWRRGGAP